MKQPEWVDLVKTAVYKELAPFDEDWFLIRMASLARHIYIRAPIGVKTAKRIYGGTEKTFSFFHHHHRSDIILNCRTQEQRCEAVALLRQLRLCGPQGSPGPRVHQVGGEGRQRWPPPHVAGIPRSGPHRLPDQVWTAAAAVEAGGRRLDVSKLVHIFCLLIIVSPELTENKK